jgi:hypothetical protein
MGPLIADLIVLLQKNRQACFMKDSYREPKENELLSWEKENLGDDDQSTSCAMTISRTP